MLKLSRDKRGSIQNTVAIKRSIRVLQNNRIEDGIYDMRLEAEDIVADATPGQFISLYCNEGGRMLPGP